MDKNFLHASYELFDYLIFIVIVPNPHSCHTRSHMTIGIPRKCIIQRSISVGEYTRVLYIIRVSCTRVRRVAC